ncbi:MAG: ABC transporter substrate-binding protein [Stappiaceae bacterium]
MKNFKSVLVGGLLAATALAGSAAADNIKVGIIGGISGPIAAMAPAMVDSAQLAISQVNEQGGIGDGQKIDVVLGDSACNPQNATDSVTKAVNVSGIVALVGPHCSGATIAAANSVTIPAGILLISPSATSPEVTSLDDKDTVFRTVPSDDYQGRALARTVLGNGTKKVAVTYLNNDYGKGLAESFKAEFAGNGGEITDFAAHEEGKASYRSNLAELAKGGADTLMIFDYGDGSGLTILRQALENGFFENFIGGDGMKSDAPIKELGGENLSTFLASSPVGEKSQSLEIFNEAFKAAGGDPDAIFVTTSYDATFLTALALEKAGGDKTKMSASLRDVSNGEGEAILPGEWEKAKKLISEGTAIDYKGAAGDQNFDEKGDVPGTYALFKVSGDAFELVSEMK